MQKNVWGRNRKTGKKATVLAGLLLACVCGCLGCSRPDAGAGEGQKNITPTGIEDSFPEVIPTVSAEVEQKPEQEPEQEPAYQQVAASELSDMEILEKLETFEDTEEMTLEEILSYTKLPVISITTDSSVKSYYGTAMMSAEGLPHGELIYDGAIEIKLRGNSTKYRDKQPYKIKLEDKTDLYSMGKNKHWVLLANDIDHALIRNKITLDFADAIGMEFASESVFVTLVLNGEYQGVYQLCEHIRVDEGRVDIFDWDEYFSAGEWSEELDMDKEDYEAAANTPQTGGFLLEADFYASEEWNLAKVTTKFKQPFYFNTPENVPANSELYNYAKNYIQSFEYALHSDNFIYHADDVHYSGSPENSRRGWKNKYKVAEYTDPTFDNYHYTQLFDMDSLVQNFLVCELAMNWDSMKNSVFLYKDIEGLAKMGPVWDFDWAYGNVNMYNINTWYPTSWHTTNDNFTREQYYQSVQWNRYLIKDPYFLMKVYEKYLEIKDTVLADFEASLKEYEVALAVDGKLNDLRWGYTYIPAYYGGGRPQDYFVSCSSLQGFIYKRLDWLNSQFKDFDTLVSSLGYFKASDKLRVEKVTASEEGSDGTACHVIEVIVTDASIAKVECQINGTNLKAAEVIDGKCTIAAPAEWFTDGMDMIHVRAMDAEGSYLHVSEEPEAATVGNYFLYE